MRRRDRSESESQQTSPSSWRVFCAIEIPEDVRRRVVEYAARLREAMPTVQASWSRMENIHLTLKFFGNVETENIPTISKAADEAVQHFSPFKIRVEGVGAFPKHGSPRVLWIGMNDASGRLTELQKEFDISCGREGFASEDRAFHPHLTVARLRSPNGARQLAELHKKTGFEAADFVASEIIVFRSELSSKGSRYTVISKHSLKQ